ncbi:MAG TPA: helix-turn-helix domain-containing protein [Nocardioidaceae bacterium]|nr:helix-turn-helix domain-containing protein [Nocardioidaceae bacterium]
MVRSPRARGPQRQAARNDQALLRAAREVVAEDGAHASVAAIARRAGVGVGSLYRRYRSKVELFQHLSAVALDEYLRAAEEGLRMDDPWDGLAHYLSSAVESGSGSLGPMAGEIEVTEEMDRKNRRSDEAVDALVERAHAAGVLRADVTTVDLSLLIEQLRTSPLIEQLRQQGHTDLLTAAASARSRLVAIALDGLRAGAPAPLPGDPPNYDLISKRWEGWSGS